jgi:hypothetical protein
MVGEEQVGASGDLLQRETFAVLLEPDAFATEVGVGLALLGADGGEAQNEERGNEVEVSHGISLPAGKTA